MSWLRRLVAGFSSRILGFNPRPIHEEYVVDKVSMEQDFLRIRRLCSAIINPQLLHTQISFIHRQHRVLKVHSVGAQILGASLPWLLNFVQWRLIFVGPQYGTCFVSPLWRVEFWGASKIYTKFVHLWFAAFLNITFPSLSLSLSHFLLCLLTVWVTSVPNS
jgi:hypothetical protein